MNLLRVNDAWYTTSTQDDFLLVLRMIGDELMQFAWAIMSLVFVLLSTINVTARLVEYALNVTIRVTGNATCPRHQTNAVVSFCKQQSVRSVITATAAMLLCWLYVNTVVGPVYLVVARPTWSIVKLFGTVISAVFRWRDCSLKEIVFIIYNNILHFMWLLITRIILCNF